MANNRLEIHKLEIQVRDYELDLQGIVNNSVYFNYLEHARHQFLLDKGVDFEGLFKEGVAAVVVKAEIRYLDSLKSKDNFIVETYASRKGRFKILFHQLMRRVGEEKVCIDAVITTACINLESKKPVEMNW